MLVTGETLGPSDRKRIIGLPHSVFTSLHFIHTPYRVFQKYRPNPQSHCGRHTEDHLFSVVSWDSSVHHCVQKLDATTMPL